MYFIIGNFYFHYDMTMGWLLAVAITTAILRLVLIVCGLFVSFGYLASSRFRICCCSQDTRRKLFVCSGVVYLFGLFPHAFLLFTAVPLDALGSWTWENASAFDSSSICWTQTVACALASSVHVGTCLWWLSEPVLTNLTKLRILTSTVQSRMVLWAAVCCLSLTAASQGVLMMSHTDDHVRWAFPDDAAGGSGQDCEQGKDSKCDGMWPDGSSSASKIVRVQLLLCEERLSAERAKSYLLLSCFAAAPTFVLAVTVWCLSCLLKPSAPLGEDENQEGLLNDGCHHCACIVNESELNRAVNIVSLVITCWLLVGRPAAVVMYAASGDGFVDFGTHLLLTLAVVIPIIFSTTASRDPREIFV